MEKIRRKADIERDYNLSKKKSERFYKHVEDSSLWANRILKEEVAEAEEDIYWER